MISAISQINLNTPYKPNFTGNKYRKTFQMAQDCFCPSESMKIVKKSFNYSTEANSVPVSIYKGPLNKTAGMSTEENGYGGGWLIGSVDTPLSTTDVHTCAVLNLVNMNTFKQLLYHVFHETNSLKIENLIRKVFPDFTNVNIVGGQQFPTVNTMRKIAEAVDNVNPNAPKTYYHTLCDNPELVAYKGNISYVKGKSGEISFVQDTEHYWY